MKKRNKKTDARKCVPVSEACPKCKCKKIIRKPRILVLDLKASDDTGDADLMLFCTQCGWRNFLTTQRRCLNCITGVQDQTTRRLARMNDFSGPDDDKFWHCSSCGFSEPVD